MTTATTNGQDLVDGHEIIKRGREWVLYMPDGYVRGRYATRKAARAAREETINARAELAAARHATEQRLDQIGPRVAPNDVQAGHVIALVDDRGVARRYLVEQVRHGVGTTGRPYCMAFYGTDGERRESLLLLPGMHIRHARP